MDDLISRQGAIDTLTTECSWTFYDEHGQLTSNGEEILGTLKRIPSTADVVEIVRCKDCRYRPSGTGCNHDLEFPVHYKCPCECDDNWYSWMPKDDFFCGNGERKTDVLPIR